MGVIFIGLNYWQLYWFGNTNTNIIKSAMKAPTLNKARAIFWLFEFLHHFVAKFRQISLFYKWDTLSWKKKVGRYLNSHTRIISNGAWVSTVCFPYKHFPKVFSLSYVATRFFWQRACMGQVWETNSYCNSNHCEENDLQIMIRWVKSKTIKVKLTSAFLFSFNFASFCGSFKYVIFIDVPMEISVLLI